MTRLATFIFSVGLLHGVVSAQFAEPFDSQAADVKVNLQSDSFADFVDYGNMTVGSTTFNIPEAPNAIAGGAAQRGLLLRSNVNPLDPTAPLAGAASAVNVLAGQSPIAFSGDYSLSYDVFLSISVDPFPTNGSTEQLLWGVGTNDDGVLEARNQLSSGPIGTWGWLANENGYGTEDAAIHENGTELADLGDTQLFEDIPFNLAFPNPVTPNAPNGAPANDWVHVEINVIGGNVQVNYNGVEFFSEPSSATNGFAMLGYEDPFGSVAAYDPPVGEPDFPIEDYQWGLFDNFRVTVIPEPSCLALILIGAFGLGRIRKA